jgi:hypothetical protein
VTETPFVNPNASANVRETSASITTTSSLKSFTMNYLYGNSSTGSVAVSADGKGKWSAKGSWPDTEDAVSWYAYSNGEFYYPYLDFTVDENSDLQKDLLVAKTSGSWADTHGVLSFTGNEHAFKHVCSALKFAVKKAKNLSDYTLSVSEVKLCNVQKHGQYDYNTASWTLGEGKTNYTLYSSATSMALGDDAYEVLGNSAAPYLFFIPQTLEAWNNGGEAYLAITCTITRISDNNEVYGGEALIPFGATLEQGYQYDVNINIGKNSLYNSNGLKIITEQ